MTIWSSHLMRLILQIKTLILLTKLIFGTALAWLQFLLSKNPGGGGGGATCLHSFNFNYFWLKFFSASALIWPFAPFLRHNIFQVNVQQKFFFWEKNLFVCFFVCFKFFCLLTNIYCIIFANITKIPVHTKKVRDPTFVRGKSLKVEKFWIWNPFKTFFSIFSTPTNLPICATHIFLPKVILSKSCQKKYIINAF